MAQWADTSSTNHIEHSSLDVNLTDFDPNYDPTYDLEANCPMCRTHTTAAPDSSLAAQLERQYPVTYAARRVEEEVDKGTRIGWDGVEGVMILIGNKHRLIRNPGDANEHEWTFFVRTSRQYIIKEVRVELVSLDLLLFVGYLPVKRGLSIKLLGQACSHRTLDKLEWRPLGIRLSIHGRMAQPCPSTYPVYWCFTRHSLHGCI